MKHTKEEILNALKIIKDECKDIDCEDCPFLNDENNVCCIQDDPPSSWKIKVETEQTWRAFK